MQIPNAARGIMLAGLLAVQSAAATFTTLYTFKGPPSDGAFPFGALAVAANGVLYGATYSGGSSCVQASGCGIVFSLTPPSKAGGAWTEAVLHSFSVTDGALPWGALTLANPISGPPVLYGTTLTGGTPGCAVQIGGCGVVFSLAPPTSPGGAWTETVLHAFAGTPHDGGNPYAGVAIGTRGVLYGATYDGIFGANSKYDGTAFAVIPPASPGASWTESVIHNFTGGDDGLEPLGGLVIGPGGILYGTTYAGGTGGWGTVFSLTPPTAAGAPWIKTVLYSFTGAADGGNPSGVAIGKTATGRLMLYGTTDMQAIPNGGTVFSLAAPLSPGSPWTQTTLHVFTGGPGDGGSPNGVVLANNGVLYGATAYGGTGACTNGFGPGCGILFSLTPPPGAPPASAAAWTEAVLYNFPGTSYVTNVVYPVADLTAAKTPSGKTILYGVTPAGGASGFGTVFSLDP